MANKHATLLSVNAGSSSLKISVFRLSKNPQITSDQEPVDLILTSSISNISSPPAKFSFELASTASTNGAKEEEVSSIKDHASAFAHFLDSLQRNASIDQDKIARVCHRVVHGGDYADPIVIDDKSYHHIEKLSDLAPL